MNSPLTPLTPANNSIINNFPVVNNNDDIAKGDYQQFGPSVNKIARLNFPMNDVDERLDGKLLKFR